MSIGSTLKRTSHFPYQKKSTAKKGKSFAIDCIEASIDMSYNGDSNLVQSKRDMIVNYNLRADILDEKDIEQAVNPWGIKGATFPAKMQNYPIANPKIDLLIGEEFKRRFDWRVMIVNADAISQKEEDQKDLMKQLIMSAIEDENYDEEKLAEEIQKLEKWSKFEAQDLRERRATQYLTYLWKEQDLKIKFNRGFEDALVAGMEVYNIDIVGGEPVVRKVDPLSLTVIRTGASYKIEDADIIIEDTYQPIRWVIDNYYDHLTSTQIDAIEKGYISGGQKSTDMIFYPDVHRPPTNPVGSVGDLSGTYGKDWNFAVFDTDDFGTQNIAAYSDAGEVRVVRVVWVSMRKVGEKSWYDEDGELQKELVDENYKMNKELGEKIDWFWINEWWEGTRIAEDIYVKWGPRPIQFRSMGNKSQGGSGYIGTLYNTNTSQSRSLMDRMKPYQYLYNVFMYRTELAFAKSKGKISVMDMSRIPEGWDMDKWMYYAEIMGWAIEDPFKESNKGSSQGKLAGQMNQNSKVIDLEMGSYIQQHVMMLDFIKRELGEIAGVNAQRQGQIENRETVGGIERAVSQSSHITEKWFMMHDNTKMRVLTALLETAKYAWRNKSHEKLQYISDEMSSVITEIDGQMFNEADYGIMISNSTNDAELIQAMKQLAQAGLQNDKINFSGLMDIYLSDSMSSMRRKIEQYEEDAEKIAAQQQQAQLDSQQQQAELALQDKKEERAQKFKEKVLESETKITVAEIGSEDGGDEDTIRQHILNIEKLKLDQEKVAKDYELLNKDLKETIRHNKVTEVTDRKKATAKPAAKK
ncbi:hypothetical protein LCGC14_1789780 [marine sediment metagenome]|uniref:Portal protein n=1 Tax=marine sediment metagenome TaxID=412755 RepID=A0A0F9JSG9_9ZZZZ